MAVSEETWARYRSWMLTHGCGLSTTAKSLRYLKWFERERGLDLNPERLTESAVVEFLAGWRQTGVKPRTLNSWVRELNLWSRYRSLGWKMGYFRRQDTVQIRVPDSAVVRKLLALQSPNPSVNSRNRAILLLLADVGIRRAELVNLQLNDRIQLASGPGLMIRFGKGERSRAVPIDLDAHAALEEYVSRYRAATHTTAMFTTDRGRVSYGYVGMLVKKAGARVGAPWLSAHKLRHFVVDSCLDAGMPVASVAELMGHVRWETTQLYRQKRLARIRAEEDFRVSAAKRSALRGTLKQIKPKVERAVTTPSESTQLTDGSTGVRRPDGKSRDAALVSSTWALISSQVRSQWGV